MTRGATAPPEQQDIERIQRTLDAILVILRDIHTLMMNNPRAALEGRG